MKRPSRPPSHGVSLLQSIVGKCRREGTLDSRDLRDLLKLCQDPREEIREGALALLLHPPVSRELLHYRRLMRSLPGHAFPGGRIPTPLLECFCEWIHALGEPPVGNLEKTFYARRLQRFAPRLVRSLARRAFPLDALVKLPGLLRPTPRDRRQQAIARRRWRLLRKRLSKPPSPPRWARLSARDLYPPSLAPSSSKFPRQPRRAAASRLLAPCSSTLPSGSLPPFPEIHWSGLGNLSLAYMEALTEHQARELRIIRRTALEASRRTGRVVLSLHNAGLAAPGGWAFDPVPPVLAGKKSEAAWGESLSGLLEASPGPLSQDLLGSLRSRWERRLAHPRIVQALGVERLKAVLAPARWGSRWKRLAKAVKDEVGKEALREMLGATQYGWHGVPSPHQETDVEAVLRWLRRRRAVWRAGFELLAVLLREGRRLLGRGDARSLVLPWIDKFFVSSSRQEDADYLYLLVRWLESRGLDPLILFWEDTVHLEAPSFQLALRRLRKWGIPCRGIGIFDEGDSKREDAVEIVQKEHETTRLFALRPVSEDHYGLLFESLLERRDYDFFHRYDSSWKDNLCFLYAGTQVFPLLSVQTEPEPFAAWAWVKGRRVPFGAYWRKRLRLQVAGGKDPGEGSSRLGRFYAFWAGLQ